jgi:hypothetical protein
MKIFGITAVAVAVAAAVTLMATDQSAAAGRGAGCAGGDTKAVRDANGRFTGCEPVGSTGTKPTKKKS